MRSNIMPRPSSYSEVVSAMCLPGCAVPALLSSLCSAEFAGSLPLFGGAYSYISAVFGEYLAW
jgi:amino acid transporter